MKEKLLLGGIAMVCSSIVGGCIYSGLSKICEQMKSRNELELIRINSENKFRDEKRKYYASKKK